MKTRRLLHLVGAGALLLSLSAPNVVADAATKPGQIPDQKNLKTVEPVDFEFITYGVEPDIKVTMSTKGTLYINPYNMPVAIGEADADLEAPVVESTDGIVSPTQYIANVTPNTAIKVAVKVTPSRVSRLVSTLPTETGGDKKATMRFEMMPVSSETTKPSWSDCFSLDLATPEGRQFTVSDVVIKKPTLAADNTVSKPGYAAYHIVGELCKDPKGGWQEWDYFDTSIAFTFIPVQPS